MAIDVIVEVGKIDRIEEVEKFNPYHDARGRFTSANSATSFTYSPGKSKAHDKAIEREKARQVATSARSGNEPKEDEYGQKHGPLKTPVSVGTMDTGTGKQVEYRVTGITQMKGDGYDNKSCRAEFKWKDKWVEVKNANSLKIIRQKYDSLTPDEYAQGMKQ